MAVPPGLGGAARGSGYGLRTEPDATGLAITVAPDTKEVRGTRVRSGRSTTSTVISGRRSSRAFAFFAS